MPTDCGGLPHSVRRCDPQSMSTLPLAKAAKGLKQGTLAFSGPKLMLSNAPALPSKIEAALAEATPPASEVTHKTHLTSSKGAGSTAKMVMDPKMPVKMSLHVGPNSERRDWCWVHVALDLRELVLQVSNKRTTYSRAEKRAIVEQTIELQPAQALKKIKMVPGFDKVNKSMLKRWRQAAAQEQTTGKKAKHGGGPKVNLTFEHAVLDELIFTSLEKVDGKEKAVVEANVAFSHDIIRRAAVKVRSEDARFKEVAKLQKYKFTPQWIRGLLRRHALRRRRITAAEKVLPAPEVVQGRMEEIQGTITREKFTKDETLSADETGIFFGAPPKNQMVPIDAERATAPDSDEKARATTLPPPPTHRASPLILPRS